MSYRVAILTTLMNPETVLPMVESATSAASQIGAEVISVTATVGCLDMPVIAQALLKQKNIDGLVVLGAVAQGDTKHDELVVNTMTQAIVQLSLQKNKPVSFGVIGPGAQRSQFKARTNDYAVRAVEAVIRNLELLQKLT